MKVANINRFIQLMGAALRDLQAQITLQQVEQMAMVVHSSMESPRRRYHCSDHALYMCGGMAPRQVLAAVFHDLVYIQLDDGFPVRVAPLLAPLVGRQGNDLVLRRNAADDPAMQLCLELFGFQPGQTLPLFQGMNEFLSAAVAVRMLQPYLALADLVAVVACIEATIPFRGPDAAGRSSAMVLAQRLREQGQHRLGLTDDAALQSFVDAAMHDAIGLANRDVDSFAEPDPGKFLSGTWQLIEESNAPLAAVGVYTLQDYRVALTRMHAFLGGLQAERVFQRYGEAPSEADYARMASAARNNIGLTVAYLELQILSISIIEALAVESGGNCPVSMFLGDVRAQGDLPERVEDYLPAAPHNGDLDPQVLRMLAQGQSAKAARNLSISPLTTFVYGSLGPDASRQAMADCQRMRQGEQSPMAFLQRLPAPMVQALVDACCHIALSRKERLQEIRAQLAG